MNLLVIYRDTYINLLQTKQAGHTFYKFAILVTKAIYRKILIFTKYIREYTYVFSYILYKSKYTYN